jgi:hypothetical protein
LKENIDNKEEYILVKSGEEQEEGAGASFPFVMRPHGCVTSQSDPKPASSDFVTFNLHRQRQFLVVFDNTTSKGVQVLENIMAILGTLPGIEIGKYPNSCDTYIMIPQRVASSRQLADCWSVPW